MTLVCESAWSEGPSDRLLLAPQLGNGQSEPRADLKPESDGVRTARSRITMHRRGGRRQTRMGLGGPHCPASGRACLPGRGQANPHLGQIQPAEPQRSLQPRDYRPTAVAVCLDLVYRPTPCDKVGSAADTLWTGCTWTLGMASRTARYVDSKGAGTCTRLATSETVWSLRTGPTPATSQGEEERGGESDDGERERRI